MVVLIPAYEPDTKLIDLVRRLSHHQIVVVDDGSGSAYSTIFAQVSALGADLVTLKTNCGKGYALKTGFAYARTHFPGQDVVCADSDGQHTPEDIDAVADRLAVSDAAMVLGARQFTGKVPARSKFGNAATRAAYTLATGQRLIDTQTGLRGYPAHMLRWLEEIGGDRFEYELRLLLRAAKEGLRIEEIAIATIYLEHNSSSHFRPLRDSVRVYGPLLAFAASSILAFAIDTAALLIFAALTGTIVLSAIMARLISATTNYGVNRIWVFGRRGNPTSQKTSAPRYAALALGVFAANVIMLKLLTLVVGMLIVAKVITEVALFSVSYIIQKHVVFTAPASRTLTVESTPPPRLLPAATSVSSIDERTTPAAGPATDTSKA
jgi:glycosyltransferase involved in cell wall biosynthesis